MNYSLMNALAPRPQNNAPQDYGQRQDGTMKGVGYFGPLPNKGGGLSTEISFSAGDQRGEVFGPLLVPTLTTEEIYMLLNNKQPTPDIYRKAMDYAHQRQSQGKSPFAVDGEWR